MPTQDLNVIYDPKIVDERMLPANVARNIMHASLAIIIFWCVQAFGGVIIVAFYLAGGSSWGEGNDIGNTPLIFYTIMLIGVVITAIGGIGTLLMCIWLATRLYGLKQDGYPRFRLCFRSVMILAFCGIILTYLGLAAAILGRKRAKESINPAKIIEEIKLTTPVAIEQKTTPPEQHPKLVVAEPHINVVSRTNEPTVVINSSAPVPIKATTPPLQQAPRSSAVIVVRTPQGQRPNNTYRALPPAKKALPPPTRPATTRTLPPTQAAASKQPTTATKQSAVRVLPPQKSGVYSLT